MKNILNKSPQNLEENKIDWNVVQLKMKENFGNDIYESWLRKIEFVEEFNNYILIAVGTRFIRDWITSRYLDQILQIIKSYKKEVSRIEIKILNKNEKTIEENFQVKPNEKINQNISFIKDSPLQYSRLDPNKNFDNFIVGPSNNLVYESAKKVSEDIAHYNPLYVYGGVGMGKTHILNSIGLKLREKNKLMFISAERFMYHFIKSIKKNDMVNFKDFFRKSSVFIIDDIQFISGKESLQEEFFHTFNSLMDKGSQIIISSDR